MNYLHFLSVQLVMDVLSSDMIHLTQVRNYSFFRYSRSNAVFFLKPSVTQYRRSVTFSLEQISILSKLITNEFLINHECNFINTIDENKLKP